MTTGEANALTSGVGQKPYVQVKVNPLIPVDLTYRNMQTQWLIYLQTLLPI